LVTDSAALDRSIGDLTASLGDPTRRAIYIAVRQSAEPVTSSSVAEIFQLHPNVARHHLDRLAADGYLRVTHRRPSGRSGPGAGRPAKCYEATGKPIDLHFPAQRPDLLLGLLSRVIDRVGAPNVAEVAEAVGREYGSGLAAEIGEPEAPGYEAAVTAVAKAMRGMGFQTDPEPDSRRILTTYCPFGEAATDHPEVFCSLDRGIVAGMMGAMRQVCEPVLIPHRNLAEDCITELPVAISNRR
jgi:predicted ArsR family transcriptional regulator